MNFLNKIKNSVYNPVFYSSLRDTKLSASFKYFYGLVICLSLILAFVLGIEFSAIFNSENLKKIVDLYPAELSLEIKKGIVSTNAVEPYIVKTSKILNQDSTSKNFLVIDTKQDFSVERFKDYNTTILIGKNFAVTAKRDGQFEFNDLSKFPDFSLDHTRLLHWSDTVSNYHWLISLGLFLFLFLAFLAFFSTSLVWLLIIACIVLLLARMKKVVMTYKNAYIVSMHAATLSFLLITLFILFGASQPFQFFWSLITILIAYGNLKNFPTSVPVVIPEVEKPQEK